MTDCSVCVCVFSAWNNNLLSFLLRHCTFGCHCSLLQIWARLIPRSTKQYLVGAALWFYSRRPTLLCQLGSISFSYFEFLKQFDSLTWFPFFFSFSPSSFFNLEALGELFTIYLGNMYMSLTIYMYFSKHFINTNIITILWVGMIIVPIVQMRELSQDFLIAHYPFPIPSRNLGGPLEVGIK